MEIKLSLEIDGTKYGMRIAGVAEDASGLHLNFDEVIYATINAHVAANKGQALKPEASFVPQFHGTGGVTARVMGGMGYPPEVPRG